MVGVLNFFADLGREVVREVQELVDDVAIAGIKMAQPTIDFGRELEPQMEALIQHISGTFRSMSFLAEHNIEKLASHTITLMTGSLLGTISISLFFDAVIAMELAFLGAPVYFSAAIIYLVMSYGVGYLAVNLIRETDAWIRYDSLKAGYI